MEEDIDKRIEELMTREDDGRTAGKGKHKICCLRTKRAVLISAVLLAAVIGLFRCAGGSGEEAPLVEVTALTKGDIQEKLSLTGPISGTDHVDVVSNIHAEILSMEVKEGDKVTKGQLLASLDPADLQREVEIARNACRQAEAQKAQKDKEAALGYEKAVQDYEKAQLDHSRNAILFQSGGIPQTEFEQSTNALNDARRQVESYRVENGRAVAEELYGLQAESAAFELAKKEEELENTQIRSPIEGTVVRVNSRVGQFADKVEDDKPIFSIENLENLELEIKISEYSIGKVVLGQKALITADILNGEMEEGEVIKISPTGEEKGDGSTERVIPTTIRLSSTDSRLMAGITARAQLVVREAQDVFILPVSAVFDDGDSSYIAAVEDGRVRRIPVVIGTDGELNVEIIPAEEGALTEGMRIITSGGVQYTDGQAVTVREE